MLLPVEKRVGKCQEHVEESWGNAKKRSGKKKKLEQRGTKNNEELLGCNWFGLDATWMLLFVEERVRKCQEHVEESSENTTNTARKKGVVVFVV